MNIRCTDINIFTSSILNNVFNILSLHFLLASFLDAVSLSHHPNCTGPSYHQGNFSYFDPHQIVPSMLHHKVLWPKLCPFPHTISYCAPRHGHGGLGIACRCNMPNWGLTAASNTVSSILEFLSTLQNPVKQKFNRHIASKTIPQLSPLPLTASL